MYFLLIFFTIFVIIQIQKFRVEICSNSTSLLLRKMQFYISCMLNTVVDKYTLISLSRLLLFVCRSPNDP